MGALDGRVAIVTGGGRGLGREHALLLASEGARVVVNDRSSTADDDDPRAPAQRVVDEIRDAGGEAVANQADVSDWVEGRDLIALAVDTFGGLDVLVNNAGILRDSWLAKMSEQDWDEVVTAHLKGHFVCARWATHYWISQHKVGRPRKASIVNTSSTSGLIGNPGQANYGAAKAGVAAFSNILALELAEYAVRSNCVVPAATRTRLTETTPGLAEVVQPPEDPEAFDVWHPGNVSPVVGYLATADCPFTGKTFHVHGGTVRLFEPWRLGPGIERDRRWTVAELIDEMGSFTG